MIRRTETNLTRKLTKKHRLIFGLRDLCDHSEGDRVAACLAFVDGTRFLALISEPKRATSNEYAQNILAYGPPRPVVAGDRQQRRAQDQARVGCSLPGA